MIHPQTITSKNKDFLQLYNIPYGTKEWYEFRTIGAHGYAGGYGASESAKLFGLDPYPPSAPELFHHKVGTYPITQVENVPVFFGQLMEPHLLEWWKYWEGNGADLITKAYKRALQKEKPFREYAINRSYMVNQKIPWLFCSLDAMIPAGQVNCEGEVLDDFAPLESKTINLWAAEQWDMRCPPKYRNQVQQQMLVTDTKYSEIVMLEQNEIRVYYFKRDEEFCKFLLEVTYQNWQNVLKGRQLVREYHLNMSDPLAQEQILGNLQHLEPPPDETKSYTDFVKERLFKMTESAVGNVRVYSRAKEYVKINEMMKYLDKRKQLVRNDLLNWLRSQKARTGYVPGANGLPIAKITYGQKTTITIKEEPTEESKLRLGVEAMIKEILR